MGAGRNKRNQWDRWMDFSIFVILILFVMLLCQKHEDYRNFQKLIDEATSSSTHVSNSPAQSPQRKEALAILHQVHRTLMPRWAQLTEQGRTRSFTLFTPSQVHLNEPLGACASFSHVLARTLRQAGFPVRKVGLSRDGVMGIHHVLEVQIDGQWVLMDAFYDQTFERPDGSLADAATVGAAWDYYQHQVSADYDARFDYSGFYYTNWNRVPGFRWLNQWQPSWKAWVGAEEVSLQFAFLDIKLWYIGALIIAALGLLWFRLKRRAQVRQPKQRI